MSPIARPTGPTYVTVAYIPEGRSVPEERTVYDTEDHPYQTPRDSEDELTQTAIDFGWEAGEPLDVRDQNGRVLWTNSRYGDLS